MTLVIKCRGRNHDLVKDTLGQYLQTCGESSRLSTSYMEHNLGKREATMTNFAILSPHPNGTSWYITYTFQYIYDMLHRQQFPLMMDNLFPDYGDKGGLQ